MSVFNHIPLGKRIPASVHGVSCSLPTMRDVVGYETKAPETMQHLCSGYPRFVQHPYLKKAAEHVLASLGLTGKQAWLTASAASACALQEWLAPVETQAISHAGLHGVAFDENPEIFASAKTFLQHTGSLLSSREAEDYLLRTGELSVQQAEVTFDGDAHSHIRAVVAKAFGHASADDVFLASSGMNAVYSAFRAAAGYQTNRGRTIWIQLGWLYLDTIAILKKFTANPADDYIFLGNVFDLGKLKEIFLEKGARIAGVFVETPTNPLIQTPDLPEIQTLCREAGAILIVDPTIASPLNLDVLPYCDVAVNSLTKYAANEGDVVMGVAVVNPESQYASHFRKELARLLEPVYTRDAARLAAQIGDYEAVIAKTNQTAPVVVEFLRQHPKIKNLRWSHHPDSRERFMKLARRPDAHASMISFTVDGPLAAFYDRLRLPKGASFGMKTTLVCPFIFLAHYDLVTSDGGRGILKSAGLEPELVRLSLGCEPAQAIIEALAEALA